MLACKNEDIPSWLQPNGCAAYGKQGENNSKAKIEQLRIKPERHGKAEDLRLWSATSRNVPSGTPCRGPPLHHAGDLIRSFFPGDLSVLPPGWVLATPVLEAGGAPCPELGAPYPELAAPAIY